MFWNSISTRIALPIEKILGILSSITQPRICANTRPTLFFTSVFFPVATMLGYSTGLCSNKTKNFVLLSSSVANAQSFVAKLLLLVFLTLFD